MTELGRDMPQ